MNSEEIEKIYDLNFPLVEGFGKNISRYDDGSKVRGRRGAKSNLNHNSTLRKYIARTCKVGKYRSQDRMLKDNFLVTLS